MICLDFCPASHEYSKISVYCMLHFCYARASTYVVQVSKFAKIPKLNQIFQADTNLQAMMAKLSFRCLRVY